MILQLRARCDDNLEAHSPTAKIDVTFCRDLIQFKRESVYK